MNTSTSSMGKWAERSNAVRPFLGQTEPMFERLFESSADAIWLYDPVSGVFLDCNQAAVDLMRCGTKEALLQSRPEDLSPLRQPDGSLSGERALELSRRTELQGSHRFEWLARRFDGAEVPLEVIATPIPANGHNIHVVVSRDMTERKRYEQALRESQQLLASIADNISEAIYRSAEDHRLTFVNQAYLRLFRYESLAELQSIPRENLYANPATRAHLLDMLASDGAFANQEVEYVRKDGTRFWGLASGRLIHGNGQPSYHVGAITDITERKEDEAEIRNLNLSLERRIQERTAELSASEARLRTLVEHAPEAIVVFDGQSGRFLFGNAKACDLYGCTPEQLPTLSPADVSPEFQPDGRRSLDLACEKMCETLAGGTPVFEWVHRSLKGRVYTAEVRLVRLPGDQSLIRASILDTTERKQAEEALRESEQKFRALFTASSQGVILHDETHYLAVNPAAARILGYNCPSELIGRHPADTSPTLQPNGDSSADLANYYIRQCLAEGSARFEWMAKTPRGSQIPLEVILTRIPWGGRQIIQAFISDISERKRAEAELLKALAREKELGQLKNNFVSMVSHEFRTPLGVILSSAEILDTYFEELDPADRREQLQSIQKNTRRMAELMEEVLLLGMAEAGKLEFHPDQLELDSFCRRIMEEVISATNHRCPIELQLKSPPIARADERLLRHIFSNLLSNAIKYSPRDSAVTLAIEAAGPTAVFRVVDRGVGIAPEDKEWLFRAFHRGRNVGEVPGSGLGLTIVKRCVELHGGSIEIESAPGQGTTVTVRLPLFT